MADADRLVKQREVEERRRVVDADFADTPTGRAIGAAFVCGVLVMLVVTAVWWVAAR